MDTIEIIMHTENNDIKEHIGAIIHNKLTGRQDYIDSDIVLNINDENKVILVLPGFCNVNLNSKYVNVEIFSLECGSCKIHIPIYSLNVKNVEIKYIG